MQNNDKIETMKNIFGFTATESAQIRKMAEEAVASGKLLDLKNDAVFKSFFFKGFTRI